MLPFVDSAEYVSGAREGPRKQLQTAYYRQTPPETPRRGVSYISDLLDNFGSGGRDRYNYIYCLNTVFNNRSPVFLCTESVLNLCTEWNKSPAP